MYCDININFSSAPSMSLNQNKEAHKAGGYNSRNHRLLGVRVWVDFFVEGREKIKGVVGYKHSVEHRLVLISTPGKWSKTLPWLYGCKKKNPYLRIFSRNSCAIGNKKNTCQM